MRSRGIRGRVEEVTRRGTSKIARVKERLHNATTKVDGKESDEEKGKEDESEDNGERRRRMVVSGKRGTREISGHRPEEHMEGEGRRRRTRRGGRRRRRRRRMRVNKETHVVSSCSSLLL